MSTNGNWRFQAALVLSAEGSWSDELSEGTYCCCSDFLCHKIRPQHFRCKQFITAQSYCYLQTQLRSQVLTKLQKQECSIHAAVPSSEALWRNVMNSLIVDYLSACHYHYTLSVFQPEADISGLQALTHADILQFMQVSPGSPLQTALGTKCTLSTADGEPPAWAHHMSFMIWAAGMSCSQCCRTGCSTGMTLKQSLQPLHL